MLFILFVRNRITITLLARMNQYTHSFITESENKSDSTRDKVDYSLQSIASASFSVNLQPIQFFPLFDVTINIYCFLIIINIRLE